MPSYNMEYIKNSAFAKQALATFVAKTTAIRKIKIPQRFKLAPKTITFIPVILNLPEFKSSTFVNFVTKPKIASNNLNVVKDEIVEFVPTTDETKAKYRYFGVPVYNNTDKQYHFKENSDPFAMHVVESRDLNIANNTTRCNIVDDKVVMPFAEDTARYFNFFSTFDCNHLLEIKLSNICPVAYTEGSSKFEIKLDGLNLDSKTDFALKYEKMMWQNDDNDEVNIKKNFEAANEVLAPYLKDIDVPEGWTLRREVDNLLNDDDDDDDAETYVESSKDRTEEMAYCMIWDVPQINEKHGFKVHSRSIVNLSRPSITFSATITNYEAFKKMRETIDDDSIMAVKYMIIGVDNVKKFEYENIIAEKHNPILLKEFNSSSSIVKIDISQSLDKIIPARYTTHDPNYGTAEAKDKHMHVSVTLRNSNPFPHDVYIKGVNNNTGCKVYGKRFKVGEPLIIDVYFLNDTIPASKEIIVSIDYYCVID